MQIFADGLLKPHGLQDAGIHIAEKGVTMVEEHAPVEFGDLRKSGHPKVTKDGATIYDRPPVVGRLSEAELKAKHRTTDLGL